MRCTMNPFKRFRGKHVVATFDNPGDLRAALRGTQGEEWAKTAMRGDGFYSGQTYASALEGMIAGDADAAARADKLMGQLAAVDHATVKRARVNSPYGRVSVGSYLASDPMPCRRRVEIKTQKAPVSIVASLNSMADVATDALERRGVVIAALVKKVAMQRPVNLYLSRFSSAAGNNSCMLVKFPTTPIDSYRLAYLLSNQGFCRGIGFAFHNSFDTWTSAAGNPMPHEPTSLISFAGDAGYSQRRGCPFAHDLRDFLGEDVLYIPGSDPADPTFKAMTKNPVAWLNDTIATLTKGLNK